MSSEELDQFEAQAQLSLYQEYKTVCDLFTYSVETDRRFYLANAVVLTPMQEGANLYFRVELTDVWVWDVFRKSRFVKKVEVYSRQDVNVEERASQQDLLVPDLGP